MSEMMKELNPEEMQEVSGGVYGDGTVKKIEYTVVKNDNLSKLAKKFNTTVDSIMALNSQIKSRDLIRVGWNLIIRVNDK